MFYIKYPIHISPGVTADLRMELTENNVFTRCADCGRELPIDLLDWAANCPSFDYGLAIYCRRCTERRFGPGGTAHFGSSAGREGR